MCCLSRSAPARCEEHHRESEAIEEPTGPRWRPASEREVEILRVTLSLPSARSFFELFFADDAIYSILDVEKAWQINGSLGKWTPGRRRLMSFDVPTAAPAWASSWAPTHAHIKQMQAYRFVSIDCNSRGEPVPPGRGERFEFTREIFSCGVPFQDAWYGQQMWTAEPVYECGEWCCMVTVTADVFYNFKPQLLVATVVTRKFLSESKKVVEHWRDHARAAVLSSSSLSEQKSLVGEALDSQRWKLNAGPLKICMILLLLVLSLPDMVRACAIKIGLLSGAHSFTQVIGYFGGGANSLVIFAMAYCIVALLFTGLWQGQAIAESASKLRVAR